MRSTSPTSVSLLLALSGSLLACADDAALDAPTTEAASGVPELRVDAPGTAPADAPSAPETAAKPASGAASSVFPAPHPGMPQIPRNGGTVLHDPSIVTVTFPGDPLEQKIHAFAEQVGSLRWWSTVHEGYGVGPATTGGHVTLREAAPASLTDADVQRWVSARIADGTLPAPTDQSIYTIYYPQTTVVSLEGAASCQVFLGYHSTITVPYHGQNVQIAYAVVNRCSTDLAQLTVTASHELTEAATDPHPIDGDTCGYVTLEDNAWTGLGGENGDMCAGVSPVTEAGWTLTRVWNNVTAAAGDQPCLPAPETNGVPYFNAGLAREVLSVPPGGAVSTEVDCYSFGPLSTPMTLDARGTLHSPLRFAFDRRTCTNGERVTLTVSVPTGTARGLDHRFTLFTSVAPESAHLWRGIVHVQ